MASRKDIVAGGAAIEIKAIDQASKVVRDVATGFAAAGQQIVAVGMRTAAAAAAATAAIVALTVVSASMAAAVDDAAKRTGFSAESLQEFRYGAEQSGGTFDDLVGGIRNMNKELADDKSEEKLAAIGLKLSDLRRLSGDQQFLAIADAISKISDASKQTDAAMGIFGKGGFALLPFLQEGQKGINQFRMDAQRLGLVLGGDVIAKFAEFDDTVARINASTQAVSALFAASFLPVLQPIADAVTTITASLATWLASNQQVGSEIAAVIGIVGALGVTLYAVGSVLMVPIGVMASFATIVGGVAAILGGPLTIAAGVVLGVLTALAFAWAGASLATTDFDKDIVSTTGSIGQLIQWLNSLYDSLGSSFGKSITSALTALRSGDFYSAGKVAFLGLKLATNEAMQWIYSQIAEVQSTIRYLLSAGTISGPSYQWEMIDSAHRSAQESMKKEIDKLSAEIEIKDGQRMEAAAAAEQERLLDLERRQSEMQAQQLAQKMQQGAAAASQTGFEPGASRELTIGTAASGVASMLIAPTLGGLQPMQATLAQQLTVQQKIERNTAAVPAWGV